ncbi:Uncharacterised protein [Fusobacterium necrogenes]|uniref:Uncharacterized protein n=1 Tax=Fusobacterium necrogenes TaxID=858 RepID=A0A377GZI7_9FUSO|nr:Uncharacterised protein [Fusobacterium necrogenes]
MLKILYKTEFFYKKVKKFSKKYIEKIKLYIKNI